MNRSDITFADLKRISSAHQKKNDAVLVDYLNSFEGVDVFEKFKNILISWESDVASSLNLNLSDKPTKIALSYIMSEFPSSIGSEVKIIENDVEITLDIPKTFDILVQEELIPIYSLIQYIKMFGVSINLVNLSVQDKQDIVDKLPAKLYNVILNTVLTEKSKIVSFNNPMLDKFKFNFLINEPFIFLKGLFTNYNEEYFRDVIFHLSKRIDGNILLNSTPIEIEYYIQKYSEEMKTQNNDLTI